ncbi:hypothetical protein F511_12122 [Dorcoceras hygrometricum]|uniref:Late embryogenesis abundant protein n=1 Tax=Dorcoceras hygrometricum TaxID=472368 RepID=A0A2Z7DJI2_9LAMI|nr:hypothetical protein F511_12122 [Dorcoceras hygrometricum]
MQAIKEKLNDMSAMRKAKAEAKQEEKEEKELAKARVEVAHEVRLAREAEAAMDLHVNKAAEKVAEHERKHPNPNTGSAGGRLETNNPDSYTYARNPNSPVASPRYSTNATFGSAHGGDPQDPYAWDGFDTTANVESGTTAGTGNRSGGPPTNLL